MMSLLINFLRLSLDRVRTCKVELMREKTAMSQVAKPQNRFLDRARISEMTFAKILYLWIHGETYSSIPNLILKENDALERILEPLDSLNLSRVGKTQISRQALHTQINAAATKINVMVYVQRVELLKDILFEKTSDATNARPYALRLISDRADVTADQLIEEAKCQTVTKFIQAWGKIVYLVSSNQIPYEAMRSVKGVKPFDIIMPPVIVNMMRMRHDRFRGYKLDAMQTHIAHHFALRMGLAEANEPLKQQDICLSASKTVLTLLDKFRLISA